jgi:hypothetical protein
LQTLTQVHIQTHKNTHKDIQTAFYVYMNRQTGLYRQTLKYIYIHIDIYVHIIIHSPRKTYTDSLSDDA